MASISQTAHPFDASGGIGYAYLRDTTRFSMVEENFQSNRFDTYPLVDSWSSFFDASVEDPVHGLPVMLCIAVSSSEKCFKHFTGSTAGRGGPKF